jgi:hypothetical protein
MWIGDWPNVSEGQVLTYKLNREHTLAIAIKYGGGGHAAVGVTPANGHHIISFNGGWVLEVKVIGEPFDS